MTSPFSEPQDARLRSSTTASLAVALLAACADDPATAGPDTTGKPNVLLISIDTLRADHMGVYGYERPTSPEIDAFAETATVFDSAHASSSWTLPGMGSVMTSTYSSTHKLWNYNGRLSESFATLTELLTAAGYDSACVVSHIYCTTRHGLQQGFVHFDDAYAFPVQDADETITSHVIADKGVRFLEQKAASTDALPWFLWLHFFDPHGKYLFHEGYSEPFVTPGTRDNLRTDIDNYDGEIFYTDHHVGRVFDALAATGFDANTIVVVVSDHGEEFLDHGSGDEHGHSLFAELVRVPLIVRAPGFAPRRVEQPVRTVDILPTVLDLAGVPLPDAVAAYSEGESLRARMRGELDAAPPALLSEVRLSADSQWESVIDGSLKLIRRYGVPDEERETMLFDIAADPTEQKNLAAERPDDVARLNRTLDALIERAAELGQGFDAGEVELSMDDHENMAKLGYVDGGAEGEAAVDPVRIGPLGDVDEHRITRYGSGQTWSEIRLVRGVPEGRWRTWYENGKPKSDGAFADGRRVGKWTTWFDNGEPESRGSYVDGEHDGFWEHWFASGQIASRGAFANGRREGLWETFFPTGKPRTTATYADGLQHGTSTKYWENGHLKVEREYTHGVRDGRSADYYEDGQIKQEEHLKLGTRHGLARAWRPDGSLQGEIPYRDGREHGEVRLIRPDGSFAPRSGIYEDGAKVSELPGTED